MGTRRNPTASVLFLVRLGVQDAGADDGQVAWRGKVQRIVDGESHAFTSLQALIDLLQAMLRYTKRS